MKKFQGEFVNGGMNFGSNTEVLKDYSKKHEGQRFDLIPYTPESKYQRNFYHGAILKLWAYLDGKDYTDDSVIDQYHETAKIEFNGEIFTTGKLISHKIGKSTRGELNKGYLERIIDYLEENYAIKREEVLNPLHYKDFRDRIYMQGKYKDYIVYLVDLRLLGARIPLEEDNVYPWRK